MKSDKTLLFLITALILTIAGLCSSIYFLFIAENMNFTVFFSSLSANLLIIIILTRHIYKSRRKEKDKHPGAEG